MARKSATVQVSPRSQIPRPWNYRSSFNTNTPGLLELARGDQLWNLKRYPEAQAEFTKAVAAGNDKLPMARWKLADTYILSGEADRALELLVPMEARLSPAVRGHCRVGLRPLSQRRFSRGGTVSRAGHGASACGYDLAQHPRRDLLEGGRAGKGQAGSPAFAGNGSDQETIKELLATAETR